VKKEPPAEKPLPPSQKPTEAEAEPKKKTPFAGIQLQSLLDAMLKNKAIREEKEAEDAKYIAQGLTPPPRKTAPVAAGEPNSMMNVLRNGIMKKMEEAKKEVEVKKFQQMLKEEEDPN